MNNKPIAVLLAVYNGEKYLPAQLDSLVAQTNSGWTLYIRDDASTDSTREIIKDYCERYSNFILLTDELGNLKCARNFFRLLDVVESEYYMFCDGDDVWLPDKIEITLQRMKELEIEHANKPLLVHTDQIVVDENLVTTAASHWKSINLNPEKYMTYNLLGVCPCVGGATMLFNRAVKTIVFPLPPVIVLHDFWVSLQTIKHGIISTLKVPTIKYRQHGSNVCGVTLSSASNYSFKSKIANLKELFRTYRRQANMRKAIGWGSFPKYLFYKLIVIIKLRLMRYD